MDKLSGRCTMMRMVKFAVGVGLLLVGCASSTSRPSTDECEDAEATIRASLGTTAKCETGPVTAKDIEPCRVWAECKATHLRVGGSLL